MHARGIMSAQTDTDISEAIAALGKSLGAMQERLAGQDERIAELKTQRRSYLDGEVQRLMPDISGSSLQRLQDEMPDFVDPAVQSAFAGNRKFLGLFAGPAYRQALLGLQTRLAHRLEGGRDPMLKETGRELTHLLVDRDDIARLQDYTQGIFDQLQQVQNTGTALSPAVMEEIARIAQKAREMEEENAQQRKKKPKRVEDDDTDNRWYNDDPWIGLASGISSDLSSQIPCQVRGGGGTYDGSGASADFSSDDASSGRGRSGGDSRNDSGMAMAAGYLASGMGGGSGSAGRDVSSSGDDAGVGLPDIATDDSLGTFS